MTNDSFEVIHNEPESRYEIDLGGGKVAVLDYQKRGNRIVMQHTGVPTEFRGKGIAALLTRYALDDVREQGLQVVPRCSYVASYIARHPEYEAITAREV